MKIFICITFIISAVRVNAQIFTQNTANGSITITPKGMQGSTNSGAYITNLAFGSNALKNNTTGIQNTANGISALESNTTGNYNTAYGYNTLIRNTTGISNTANGYGTLSSNTTGHQNTAIGHYALNYNTTASGNTAIGYYALLGNTIGYNNTANGYSALLNNMTGVHNTASGYYSLYSNLGSYNTAYGSDAGNVIRMGLYNTFIGASANSSTENINNSTAIGYFAIVNASNKVRIGNDNVTVIEGQVAWSHPSDKRLKENIIYTNRLGLDFINQLQTVSYNYKADKTQNRYDGFVAQDIEQIINALNVPFSGLKKSDDGMYSLAYSDFIMPLVNAVKELKKQNEILEQRLSVLEELRAEIIKIKAESAVKISDRK